MPKITIWCEILWVSFDDFSIFSQKNLWHFLQKVLTVSQLYIKWEIVSCSNLQNLHWLLSKGFNFLSRLFVPNIVLSIRNWSHWSLAWCVICIGRVHISCHSSCLRPKKGCLIGVTRPTLFTQFTLPTLHIFINFSKKTKLNN